MSYTGYGSREASSTIGRDSYSVVPAVSRQLISHLKILPQREEWNGLPCNELSFSRSPEESVTVLLLCDFLFILKLFTYNYNQCNYHAITTVTPGRCMILNTLFFHLYVCSLRYQYIGNFTKYQNYKQIVLKCSEMCKYLDAFKGFIEV